MQIKQQKELVALINKYAVDEDVNETKIPRVSLFKASSMAAALPGVYNPCLCIIAQGQKQVMLDNEIYRYGPSQYLSVSVDLPLMNRIIKASKDEPYLLLKIDIDLQQLSELLIRTGYPVSQDAGTERGIFVGSVDDVLGDSVLRLARLLDAPDDIPVLANQTIREILYRVLRSGHGSTVAQIALKGSRMERIARAIRKLKTGFREAITVEGLAELAGMSVSSFHAHFKNVTAMSPLQFQKKLRLIESRNLMFTKNMDAASTAYHVGYESPAQFNREYSRMFGNPPVRDISLLKQQVSNSNLKAQT